MLKKLLIVVMCIALLGFIGVGCKTEAAPDEEAMEEETAAGVDLTGVKIGFVNAGPDDYYAQFGNTFKAIAEDYGMDVTELNSDYKPEQELANVQDLIAKGVEAIAVITAGAEGSAATIEAANDAGVPIFFIAGKPAITSGTDLAGHVTDNFVIMGYQVGKWVIDNVEDPVAVNIPGFLGQGPAEGEIVGFDLAFTEAGLESPFLTASSEWQRTLAIPITQDLVISGREFNVLFACNEETAAGVLTVFEEQNVTGVTLVSCNGKEEGWAWLESGQMSATSPNPPSLNADISVQQIVRQLSGEDFLQYLQIMPWDVLTKDNLDKAIPWITADYLAGRTANEFQWDLAFYEKAYTDNADVFVDFDAKLVEYLANS
ncbi:MAG: sugar ABC transporter substrate-binding protein [Actinobacteria bacterium]|nr:sugar ABC transporter substrate-binding protein [Actinomycetota bacterium]